MRSNLGIVSTTLHLSDYFIFSCPPTAAKVWSGQEKIKQTQEYHNSELHWLILRPELQRAGITGQFGTLTI